MRIFTLHKNKEEREEGFNRYAINCLDAML